MLDFGPRSAPDALLALHEEVLALRTALHHAEGSLAASLKARATLGKQLRTANRAGATTTKLAEQNAERASRAEVALAESRHMLHATEARLAESERERQALQERVRALELSGRESLARYTQLAAESSALEAQSATLQQLLNSFRERAVQLKADLQASDAKRRAASDRLVSFVSPGMDGMFSFDDGEVQSLVGRVVHNLACPIDIDHLKRLFRIPSDGTDRRTHGSLSRHLSRQHERNRDWPLSGFCHASSPLWRRLRHCLMAFWRVSSWDLMRLRPGVVHALMSTFADYLVEFAAVGTGPLATKDDDQIRDALVAKMGNLEITRRALCKIHRLGERKALYGDSGVSASVPSEGAKSVISQLAVTAYDAGSPWAHTSNATIDKDDPDARLRSLLGEGPSNRWLEKEHGVYSFDTGRVVHYRYVHPPSEYEPIGVVGVTLGELYERMDDAKRARAAARQRPNSGPVAPLGRSWMRDARFLVAEAHRMFSGIVGTSLRVDCASATEVSCCRMLAQMMLVAPRLSVVDFVVAYRTMMLTRHHRWVLRSANALLGCADAEASDSDGEADAPQAEGKKSAEPDPQEPAPQGQAKVPQEDAGALYSIRIGDDEPGTAKPADSAPPKFSVPTVGMPAVCVRIPSELTYEIARARCRVPVTMQAQRSCLALDISRQIIARVFINFTDEPEFADLMGMDDWMDMMSAFAERGLTMRDVERAMTGKGSTEHEASGAAGGAASGTHGAASGQAEVVVPGIDAMMHNLDDDQGPPENRKLPRFVFGYSRGIFIGARIHVFVASPRVVSYDVDLPNFAADALKMTRVALGVMIGMRRPRDLAAEGGRGPDHARWVQRFYPPAGTGHAFMLELIRSLYTSVHAESLLRVYA
jgi:hypothetical protein